MHTRFAAAAVAAVLAIIPAASPARSQMMPGPGGERVIDVSVNYAMNVPLKGEDAANIAKGLEAARRAMYEIAASECTVILATIASSCALNRLNVQSNMQRHLPGQEMAHVSANASYKVVLREAK